MNACLKNLPARLILRWMPSTARFVYEQVSIARHRQLLAAFGEPIDLAGPNATFRLHPSLDVQHKSRLEIL